MKIETIGDTAVAPKSLLPSLDEIGRRILDKSDAGEVENPRTVAIQAFVVAYVREHSEDFEEADDGGYIYSGGN